MKPPSKKRYSSARVVHHCHKLLHEMLREEQPCTMLKKEAKNMQTEIELLLSRNGWLLAVRLGKPSNTPQPRESLPKGPRVN